MFLYIFSTFGHSLEARTEICKKNRCFLDYLKRRKKSSEINWPVTDCSGLFFAHIPRCFNISKTGYWYLHIIVKWEILWDKNTIWNPELKEKIKLKRKIKLGTNWLYLTKYTVKSNSDFYSLFNFPPSICALFKKRLAQYC